VKTGDKIVCINAGSIYRGFRAEETYLTEGRDYEVLYISSDGNPSIINDRGIKLSYLKVRFTSPPSKELF
jgi:hypothetical protein